MLAPLIAAQSLSQLAAGIALTAGQLAGPVGGFVTISLAAGWFLHVLLRAAAAPPTPMPNLIGVAAIAAAGSAGDRPSLRQLWR